MSSMHMRGGWVALQITAQASIAIVVSLARMKSAYAELCMQSEQVSVFLGGLSYLCRNWFCAILAGKFDNINFFLSCSFRDGWGMGVGLASLFVTYYWPVANERNHAAPTLSASVSDVNSKRGKQGLHSSLYGVHSDGADGPAIIIGGLAMFRSSILECRHGI